MIINPDTGSWFIKYSRNYPGSSSDFVDKIGKLEIYWICHAKHRVDYTGIVSSS